ncbi:MAG: FtsX-like permease family protein, partial [Saprospiraceae bacterium]|nr:FtsX-like permease family protein [Saprospiraceae bacterium]
MINNYLKMAWKVLRRRKFFTFISLFGISLTLMILILASSLLESSFGKEKPLTNRDRLVFLSWVTLKKINIDTIWTRDSTQIDGTWHIDSTYTNSETIQLTSQSSGTYQLFDNYFRHLKTPQKMSLFIQNAAFDVFLNSHKIALNGMYTDADYWQIFDFHFLEGGPYSENQINNQEQVVIISEKTRDDFFGQNEEALGREINLEGKHYLVSGVVNNVPELKDFASADIYLPYTLFSGEDLSQPILGPFQFAFLADSPQSRRQIIREISSLENKIPINDANYNALEFTPLTFMEQVSRSIYWAEDQRQGLKVLMAIIIGIISLFILVPTLNLINLNVSRIMERSSEIGVRKAFGANRYHLLYQFIFENLILTLLGGAIGLLLALTAIQLSNRLKLIPYLDLAFNLKVFIYALLITLIFGVVSGLLPAIKMSKMRIIDAIK